MPTPPKPLSLVTGHRTKAEKTVRAQGEAALKTDEKIKPSVAVRADPDALKYFKRLVKLYEKIDMNEAFYENTINRYCILLAEHDQLITARSNTAAMLDEIVEHKADMDFLTFIEQIKDANGVLLAHDRAIAKKRDQLLAIEKESLMTVQGKLRAVPKKPKDEQPSGIAAYRQRRGDG